MLNTLNYKKYILINGVELRFLSLRSSWVQIPLSAPIYDCFIRIMMVFIVIV